MLLIRQHVCNFVYMKTFQHSSYRLVVVVSYADVVAVAVTNAAVVVVVKMT